MNGAGAIDGLERFSGNGLKLKICGITDLVGLRAACDLDGVGGRSADFVGFVFCEPTKTHRFLTPDQAEPLVHMVPDTVQSVGLFVDPTDEDISAYLAKAPVAILQLHGRETPERVREIKARFGKPIIKAFSIRDAADFDPVSLYNEWVDYLLFDTKTNHGASGGSGVSFDWGLLTGRTFAKPWFLAGGLSADNLAQAWAQSGAMYFDCSSGVETDKKKDPKKIAALLRMMNEGMR